MISNNFKNNKTVSNLLISHGHTAVDLHWGPRLLMVPADGLCHRQPLPAGPCESGGAAEKAALTLTGAQRCGGALLAS